MKIESSTVAKLTLSELDALDPVTVFLEDYEPRQGKIIIECYGQSWSSYWGGMGDRTIAEFFCSCDEHYLAKNLSSVSSDVLDMDGIQNHAKAEIISLRKDKDIDKDEARELYGDAGRIEEPLDPKLMHQIYGDEWWYRLPTKLNHEYEYLCRIINAVKAGLKQEAIAA